jgi:hypothetical protein
MRHIYKQRCHTRKSDFMKPSSAGNQIAENMTGSFIPDQQERHAEHGNHP